MPAIALVAIGAPAAAAFAALLAFVLFEASGARPFSVPPPSNVSEAAAFGDAARVLGFMGAGEDPNERRETRRGMFDANASVHVTALEAAILGRHAEEAMLLLRRGARIEPSGAALACLAQAVDLGRELPPSTFGVPTREYYVGSRIEGTAALGRCGLPTD